MKTLVLLGLVVAMALVAGCDGGGNKIEPSSKSPITGQ